MKRHECPTCGQRYGCPRTDGRCGSPLVYDCFFCYVSRYGKELERTARDVADRFSFGEGDASPLACYAD